MCALWLAAGGTLVAVAITYVFLRKSKRGGTEAAPPDTVLLHQVSRGPWAPSISPFCLKLETFLRMADIPYKVVPGYQRGPKGKVPWIEYNGQAVADSHFIIQFLNDKCHKNLSAHVSPLDRAVATAMVRMCEEHLFWGVGLWRVQFDEARQVLRMNGFSPLLTWLVCRKGRSMAWQQGLGRHSRAEVTQLVEEDLQALSLFLGAKEFLTGPQPCEEDCAVFASVAQVLWHSPNSPLETIVKEKYHNLVAYCERMRGRFWPDWDDCITHGGTRPALK